MQPKTFILFFSVTIPLLTLSFAFRGLRSYAWTATDLLLGSRTYKSLGYRSRKSRLLAFMNKDNPLSQYDFDIIKNPHNSNMDVFRDSLLLHHKMNICEDPYISEIMRTALEVYKSALRLYGPDKLITSYNGGKDAVVVMHLHRAAIADYSAQCGTVYRPRVIYFNNPKDFEEVREFVRSTSTKYDLDLLEYNEGFVPGLTKCMVENGPGSYGFVLGTRKGDPNCGEQNAFTPSSDWMPPFMRVNPIINWEYGQIWHFLRTFDLPYPKLYDKGYTSLGNIHDTVRNPALRKRKRNSLDDDNDDDDNGDNYEDYYPAYMLTDWSLERAGRGQRPESTLGCELKQDAYRGSSSVRGARTAGLVIIGDEILKGKCQDTNTLYAAKRLWEKGINLQRVAVISDNLDAIAAEVRNQIQSFDLVITSGGLGPTHDDVTIHAVASALGQRIRENKTMVSKIKKNLNLSKEQQLSQAQTKLAMLPEFARLRTAPSDASGWPILQCKNVFILPGVPQFFEKKMRVIVDHFLSGHSIFVAKLVLSADEFEIVNHLDTAVSKHPSVTFGSYPFVGGTHNKAKTIITLESSQSNDVTEAAKTLQELISKENILEYIANDDSLAIAQSQPNGNVDSK